MATTDIEHKPYKKIREELYSEEGLGTIIKVLLAVVKEKDVFTSGKIMNISKEQPWEVLNCLDKLEEMRVIQEIQQVGTVAGQNRIYKLIE